MKQILDEGNQIHNFISSFGSRTVINYGSGSDFLTCYGSGSTTLINTGIILFFSAEMISFGSVLRLQLRIVL